ncbi:MAG: 50S ribosomal protein L28 [Chloroflexi bacterium]|nr:50S ribosomal protein L28 [Chloroflexota bacterium]
MAKCAITGKKPMSGNNKPFSQKRTKRQFKPNIQSKTIYVPELRRTIKIKVSAKGLKIIDKVGLMQYLKREGLTLKDIT